MFWRIEGTHSHATQSKTPTEIPRENLHSGFKILPCFPLFGNKFLQGTYARLFVTEITLNSRETRGNGFDLIRQILTMQVCHLSGRQLHVRGGSVFKVLFQVATAGGLLAAQTSELAFNWLQRAIIHVLVHFLAWDNCAAAAEASNGVERALSEVRLHLSLGNFVAAVLALGWLKGAFPLVILLMAKLHPSGATSISEFAILDGKFAFRQVVFDVGDGTGPRAGRLFRGAFPPFLGPSWHVLSSKRAVRVRMASSRWQQFGILVRAFTPSRATITSASHRCGENGRTPPPPPA